MPRGTVQGAELGTHLRLWFERQSLAAGVLCPSHIAPEPHEMGTLGLRLCPTLLCGLRAMSQMRITMPLTGAWWANELEFKKS
jgi:hypothetical protein